MYSVKKMEVKLSGWVINSFDTGSGICQLIDFEVAGNEYVMIFSPPEMMTDSDEIRRKEEKYGLEYRENSFEVKFDLKDNFDTGAFYAPSGKSLSFGDMMKLGRIIKELLNFHYGNSDAEVYLVLAESAALSSFYDRLAKRYADELNFDISNGLGKEGLFYEIRTPSYKGKSP